MTILKITNETEATSLNEIRKVTKHHHHYNCPHCGEELGRRKVQVAPDKHVVHAMCWNEYGNALRTHAQAGRVAYYTAN